MVKVPLLTRNGEFVVTVEVPPFQPPADIIIWGARIFSRTERRGHGETGADYLEAFAYMVPPNQVEFP